MRAHSVRVQERVREYIIPSKKIISYGQGNDYPTFMRRILEGSPTGIACRNKFCRYVKGKGFEDESFAAARVNLQGQKADSLLARVTKDLADFGFFAIHVNYNLLAEPTTFQRVNPEHVRLGIPDSYGTINQVGLWDSWGDRNMLNPDLVDAQYLDIWHPDPSRVLSQIQRDGGIQNYKGQIYLYTGDELTYPATLYDSVWQEMLTEAEISTYNLTRLNRGFVGKHLLTYRGLLTDEQLGAIKSRLRSMSGPGGDDIVVIDGVGEDGLDLMEIKHNQSDNLWGETEAGVRAKIMRAWGQNPILHGDFRPGSLGQSTEIENAVSVYNMETEDYRLVMESAFRDLFERWAFGEYDNFTITPIEFKANGNEADMGSQV